MGLPYIAVTIKGIGSTNGVYEEQFLVDTGATDTTAPESQLRKIGIKPVGKMKYELADGSTREFNLYELQRNRRT